MNKKTIDKASRDYVMPNANIRPLAESIAAKEGFIAGAEWRINSVWHSPTEEQEAYRPILVEFTHEDGDLGFELGLRQICLSKEAESNMIRWAYLDDLLPERKEAQP